MIAGVTGHQDLGAADAVEWVRVTFDSLVAHERISSGLTSLAEGADQLFAQVLLDRGLAFKVVVPCASYESVFRSNATRNAYTDLLRASAQRVELPFPAPSEQAFFEAGKFVVTNSDVIFAVWNGLPAKGLGGTADVVRFATSLGRRTIHVNPVSRIVATL